jgi:hypothetical protein
MRDSQSIGLPLEDEAFINAEAKKEHLDAKPWKMSCFS